MFEKLSNYFYMLCGLAALGFLGWTYWQGVQEKATVYVDNPTKQEIKVKIGDNPEMTIKAGKFEKTKLKPGEYKVSLNGKEVGSFKRESGDDYALVNPTKSLYIKEFAIYTDKATVPDSAYPPTKIIKFQGKDLEVFDSSNDVYVNFKPTYPLDENFPDSITTRENKFVSLFKKVTGNGDKELRSKIYRVQDYLTAQ